MLKTIYNLEPDCYVNEEVGFCSVYLLFEKGIFFGSARLAPIDKEFFSEKVGLNIALSRARIKVLEHVKRSAHTILMIKQRMFNEACNYGEFSPEEVDPTGNFRKKIVAAEKRYNKLREALKKEQKYLTRYIEDQDKMVERVRQMRARDKKE